MVKGKRAVILIKLVSEALEVANEKIEKEIREELLEGLSIPWCDKIEEVTVTEDHAENVIEEIKRLLREQHYSDEAIEEILKWYVE